ncbi:MAG: hypothetical protein IPP81_09260 [Chitinophagaceae bacterium]|nr:hypothetical protein [Chitinophagaceae bacterium]
MTNDFNIEFDNIDHYKNFPIMKPFIGENYFNAKKKILVIAESHFFDEKSNINSGPTKWYTSSLKDLHESKFDSINTQMIVESSSHPVFRELENVLSKSMEKYKNRALNNIAFMNGFQRPANKTGQSIKELASAMDFEIGIKTVTKVIEILKPDFVIFISKYTWEKIGKQLHKVENVKYEFINHPASIRYWHNSKYPNSKYRLIDLLK